MGEGKGAEPRESQNWRGAGRGCSGKALQGREVENVGREREGLHRIWEGTESR